MANRYWVGGTGTWTTTTTNWSATSGGASGASAPTSADDVFFDAASGTGTVTLTGALAAKSLTTTGSSFTFSSTGTPTIAGSMTLSATTVWSATGLITFTATGTITSNAVTINSPIAFNGAAQTFTLGSALTVATTSTTTLTSGTLDLGNFTLTTGAFSSSNSNTRAIAFGTTGAITCSGSGTVFTTATLTGFSYTGTSTINISNNTATATTVITGTASEAQALSFNYTTGTYSLTDTAAVYKNINWTGFAGTMNAARTIYGNWTNPLTGGTYTAGTNVQTFAATSGTQTITSNARTLDFPITKSNAGSLVLGGALTIGSTRTFSVSAGTFTPGFNVTAGAFDLSGCTINMGTYTWTAQSTGTVWNANTSVTLNSATSTIALSSAGSTALTFQGGGKTYNNLSLTGAAGTGTVTIGSIGGATSFNTLASSRTGIYTITLPASTVTTVGTWSIAGTNATTNFVTLNSSTAATQATLSVASGTVNPGFAKIQDIATTGGATFTATQAVNLGNNTGWTFPTGRYWVGGTGTWTTTTTNWAFSSGGTAGAFVPTSTDDVFFDGSSGAGTITLTGALAAKSLTTTGSSFTFSSTGTPTIAGNFTLSATTVWSATGVLTFSATGTITTNGVSIACDTTFNGTGATFTLGGTLTTATTAIGTLTTGTLALNGYDANFGVFSSTGAVARSIAFGSNFINITTTAGGTVISAAAMANFSYTGAGGFKLTGNAASATTRTINMGGTSGQTESNVPNLTVATGQAGSIVTLASTSYVNNLTFLAGFLGTFVPTATTNVYGSLTAVSGMAWTTGTGTINFIGTSGTDTITTAGFSLYAVTFNCAGTTYTLQDNLTATNSFIILAGTVTATTQNVSATVYSLSGGTLNMGSGTWTATATGAVWTATGTTVNAGTSTIALSTTTATAITFAGGGKTYNNLSLSGVAGTGTVTITGANSFNTLASSRTGIYIITLPASTTTTVTTWSITGSSASTNYFTLNSSTAGTQATLSVASGTVNPGYAKIQDSAATGGATFTTTTASDLGNNTGWTFVTTRYWVGGTGTWDSTTATNWALSSGGSGGNFPPSISDDVFFNGSSGSGTITLSGALVTAKSLTTTGSSFTFSVSSTAPLKVYGSFTLSATTVWNAATNIAFLGTGTITTTGVTLAGANSLNITIGEEFFNPTVTMNNSITRGINILTVTTGTLVLNGFNISCDTFSASGTLARGVNFGSNYVNIECITVNTAIAMATTTNFTPTGTGGLKLTGNSASIRTITIGTTGGSAATAPNVWVSKSQSGVSLTITSGSWFGNLDFTGFIGAVTLPAATNIAGSLTLVSGMFYTTGTGTITFAATATGKTIATAGNSLYNVTFNGVGGGWTLQDSFTCANNLSFVTGTLNLNSQTTTATAGTTTFTTGPTTISGGTLNCGTVTHTSGSATLGALTSTGTYTFTAGTIILGSSTLTCFAFASNNSGTREIQFGTGAITTTGSGTVWNVTATGVFSATGARTVNISNNSATATTVAMSSSTEANALDFNFTTGTYTLSLGTPGTYRNMNFTGFTGTWSPTTSIFTIYGSITLVTGMTYTTGTGVWTLAATTGTQTITSAAKTLGPITQAGATAQTVAINGALTMASTATYGLTNGTLDLTNAGAGNYTLTAGLFSSSNSNTRVIAFGTGVLTIIGSGNAWNMATVTGFSYTGTPTVNMSNGAGVATTVNTGTLTEAQALNFNYTAGGYALTDTAAVYKNINFNGFNGTLPNSARTIYGNWTNPGSGGSYTAGANAQTFAATSGTQTITSQGRTLDFPITKSNAGSTLILGGALTIGSTRTLTISAGTFTPGYNITAGLFSLTGIVNMGSNTWTASGVGTVWTANDFLAPFLPALTINAGTSTIILSDVTTSTKTFNCGTSGTITYNNLQIGAGGGSASYVFTGSNTTFNTVSSNKTAAYTVTLPNSTNITVSNWTAGGAGAYNRLTLNSSSPGTQATLILAGSGTAIGGNFMTIQDINFTPTASGTQRYVWYMGADSTFGTNVTGGALLASDPTLIGYLLTTGTSWTVPSDWSSYNNIIYLIGGGGGGGGSVVTAGNGTHISGSGGGGGGFQRASNVALTPGSSVAYTIGSGGNGGAGSTSASTGDNGGNTTFNSGAYTAGGGGGASTSFSSGTTVAGIAGTGATNAGGVGGSGTGTSNTNRAGGGGAGSGGESAAGGSGGNASGSTQGTAGSGDGNVKQYIGISTVPYGDGGAGALANNGIGGVGTGYGGGGGGGGCQLGVGTTTAGGVGTQGVIFVLYTQRLAMSNLTFSS